MKNLDPKIWKELDKDVDVKILPKNPTKLKLLADQNVPNDIVADLKKNNFAIKSIHELSLAGQPDNNILQIAKKLGYVLLTTDKDFWDEKKTPIRKYFGVFCIESGPQQTDKVYMSFAQLYLKFARFVSNEWWDKTKALLKTDGFTIRKLEDWGAISENEYKFIGRKVYVRQIR